MQNLWPADKLFREKVTYLTQLKLFYHLGESLGACVKVGKFIY